MSFDAEELIKQAIKRHGEQLGVACSFGKDSLVVLHMALKYNPNIKVIFLNTGVEFPETIAFKNRLCKEWKLNLFESKPIKSFWQCIKDYGVPTYRGRGTARTPKCCHYCKEKPAEVIQKEIGVNAILTGLMASESRQRKLTMMRYDHKKAPIMSFGDVEFCGQRWFSKHDICWKYHPIAYWKAQDVWNYIHQNDIPVNPVYYKWNGIYDRCGCLPCTAYIGWEKKLSKSHKGLYLQLKNLQNPNQQIFKMEAGKK